MALRKSHTPKRQQPAVLALAVREVQAWLQSPYRKLMQNLWFLLFLAGLGLVSIWLSHHTERQVRRVEQLETEVKDLKYEYLTLSAQLSRQRRQSNLRRQVDSLLGLKPLQHPPYVLKVPQTN